MITQKQAIFLFDYNPLTGKLFHKFSHGRAIAGNEVGWIDDKGYYRTKDQGTTYFVHRIIWLIVYGEWPDEIDHRDGDPGNNRIDNLRSATRTQNLGNCNSRLGVSGTKGVYPISNGSKWTATIGFGGQRFHLGNFDTIEEAAVAYRKAADRLYGEFALHNRPEHRRA